MPERLIVEGFEPFVGKHCETSTLKRVLDYHGLYLSEEMLLGLGGGIGFIYWYMKTCQARSSVLVTEKAPISPPISIGELELR